jgi:hypothetical protein
LKVNTSFLRVKVAKREFPFMKKFVLHHAPNQEIESGDRYNESTA